MSNTLTFGAGVGYNLGVSVVQRGWPCSAGPQSTNKGSESVKMPFRKKSSPSESGGARQQHQGGARQANRGGAAPGGAGKQNLQKAPNGNVWDTGWNQREPDPGMPGTCGYFRGVKGESHPSRFVYKRPDGQDDDGPRQEDPDAPLRPSTRPVPRGFFS